MSQSLVLVLLGGAVLRITVLSTTYVNYVKPAYRPILIAAGLIVLVLGIIGLAQEWRKPLLTAEPTNPLDADHAGLHPTGHDHAGFEHTEVAHTQAAHTQIAHTQVGDPRVGDRALSQAAAADHAGPETDAVNEHGHSHTRVPRVAWLLCLPVFAIFLIAPPALGAFAARSEEPPPRPPAPIDAYHPLSAPVNEMTLGEFVGRAWEDSKRTLTGKTVRLVGFVVPSTKRKDRWYVARMQISCCAADAVALKVAILGAAQPPENQWVEVTGTWVPPQSTKIPNGTVAPEVTATQVTLIPQPSEPYE
ncbi:TIGR03943 family protein [Streptosporangiaceae bacterium NEAU-GS5]|nr:TIGR03943 family protein [Streptosporangiaceae bacterium NEAU-GS5]